MRPTGSKSGGTRRNGQGFFDQSILLAIVTITDEESEIDFLANQAHGLETSVHHALL